MKPFYPHQPDTNLPSRFFSLTMALAASFSNPLNKSWRVFARSLAVCSSACKFDGNAKGGDVFSGEWAYISWSAGWSGL